MAELLTVDDVAERLKVSTESVRRWARSGKMRGLKAGQGWRFESSEVDRFLREHGSLITEDKGK